ncbi:MAG: condensation domain-containing protein, partial [Chitinophagaceae bacterium]
IPTLTAYILDPEMRPVPLGINGELHIGGAGLARGYLNRDNLTAGKFISNPFDKTPGARLYKTGDLGRWLPDGDIEYLGRIDDQVKIRGFRIELGEIETVLLQSGLVKEVIVLARKDGGTQQLVGYVVSDIAFDQGAISTYLKSKLPEYMVPGLWVELETLPLTANGKINKKALPEPGITIITSEFKAPESPTEIVLVSIWEKLLSRQNISIRDNFFDIGGDSIKAIRLVGLVNKLLHKTIAIKSIYEQTNLASLASFIDAQKDEAEIKEWENTRDEIETLKLSIVNDGKLSGYLPPGWEDIFPMSDIEKGMLYYTMVDKESAIYHDQLFSQLSNFDLDFGIFKKAFLLLVNKHESLRSSFDFSKFGFPVQIVHASAHEDIFFEDISSMSSAEQKLHLENFLVKDRESPFDISKPGLWRIYVYKIKAEEYNILWVIHHAIVDGWSFASLQTELSQVYFKVKENSSYKPLSLKAKYKDYVIDQVRFKKNNVAREFWIKFLQGYNRTELPLRKSVNFNHRKEFKVKFFPLHENLTTKLDDLSKELQIHIKEIYLAAFTYLLKITNYTSDVTIGLVANGRPGIEDGDKLIGCFLNTVPFRYQFRENETTEEFLRTISRNTRDLKSFDKLPLLEIVEIIGDRRDSRNPVFDIIFNYIEFHIYNERHKSVTLKEPIAAMVANTNTYFDLSISRREDKYGIMLNYLTSLYSEEDIERIIDYFKRILDSFTEDKSAVLASNNFISLDERQLLLEGFATLPSHYPKDKTIVDLFEEQVAKTPDNIAVVFEEEQLSYKELNGRANSIANYLRSKGVREETLVPICIERSVEMITGILGILKSGGAYVPID